MKVDKSVIPKQPIDNQMYNLTLHIEYLLLRHDCVIVPGLGAFINVRSGAWYDQETATWHPMTREVRFNAAISHDDGLLAGSFARKEQVSFREGRELLRRATDQVQEALRQDGEVTLGHLGILRSHEGALEFMPMYSAPNLSRMLGYAPAAKRAAVAAQVKENKDGVSAKKADAWSKPQHAADVTSQRAADGASGRKFDTEANYYIAVNKVFARVAACVAIVLVAVLSVLYPLQHLQNVDQASVMPVEKIISKAAPSIQQTVSEEKISQPAEEKAVEEKPAQVSEAGKRYHAIVATFGTAEDAGKFVEQYKGCGYRLQIVNGRTKTRVSAYASNAKDDVAKMINNPDFAARFTQAWIWDAE